MAGETEHRCPNLSAAARKIFIILSLGFLALTSGCNSTGANSGGSAKNDSSGPTKETKKSKHAGIFGFRSMDLYVQGDTVDVLLADGQMGSAFPELRHSRSSDGGETWSDLVTIDTGGVLPSNPHRGMDASIGAVGDRLLAIWTGPGESKHGKGSMATSVSTDGGRTWRLGPRIGGKESLEGASYHDILTVGDTFHLAWTDGPSSAREFRYTQSMDGGTSWEPAKTLDATTCACCWNSLANFGSEKVYGLYRDGTPRDMYLAVSSDAGNTWDLRSRVGEFGWIFDGCPHVGGSVVVEQSNNRPVLHTVVWTGQEEKVGVYYLSSRDEGKTWTKPRPMGDDGAKHADIAVAKGGILAAAWDGYVNKQYAIFASISRDGGRTWSAPQRLSQEGVSATHPKVIATSQGFRVFWTDTNEDDYITWRSVRLGEDGRKLTEAAVPVYTRGPSVTSLYADHTGND